MNTKQFFTNCPIKSSRFFSAIIALLGVMFGAGTAGAQSSSVTISPTTGSMLAGVAGGYDEWGVQRGWSSLWQHEQLPLTMNVSDFPDLTEGGQLANPAGNMCEYDGRIAVMGGSPQDCYWTVALPKGFRITGYELVLLNDLDGKTVHDMEVGADGEGNRLNLSKQFYETGYDFDYTTALAQAKAADGTTTMPGFTSGIDNDDREYVIRRESPSSEAEAGYMNNILYFVVHRGADGFYGISIKSFTIYFTAEANFKETAAPVAPTEIKTTGTSYVNYPFATQKIDVGPLNTQTFSQTGNKYLVYDFSNVSDLKANITLYEDDAVKDGAVGENGLKGITSTRNGDNYYYALKNNVYYVEAPTSAITQDGKNVNLAYRITGAKINYNLGTKNDEYQYNYEETVTETKTRDGFLIYIDIQDTRFYLDIDGGMRTYSESEAPLWQKDPDGYLHCGDAYFMMNNYRYVGIGTKNEAQNSFWPISFSIIDDGNIYYQTYSFLSTTTYYLIFNPNSRYNDYGLGIPFHFSSNGGQTVNYRLKAKAATREYEEEVTYQRSVRVPAFTPQPYTIKIYDTKTGKGDPVAETPVNDGNKTGVIDLMDADGNKNLNNDAIMFEISGLPKDAKALITVELTMQPLDPYISRLDIVCHDPNLKDFPEQSRSLTQTFIAEDFTVRGGKFVFYVPDGFDTKTDAQGNVTKQKCTFTFENLDHAYGDYTYYGRTNATGHARYYLVNSDYEQDTPSAYGSNPEAVYTRKVRVEDSGVKKFKFSNAEDLDHSNNSSTQTVYYEEYPFSRAKYKDAGGVFSKLELADTENGVRYLFTADETRYNIAPTTTTEHRSYAFYTMDVQLLTKNYDPAHEWVKIYDKTCYSDNQGKDAELPMYGLKLLTEKFNGEYGYLTTDQITRILNNNDDESYYTGGYKPQNNRPADITDLKQVLYIDASELQAVVYRKVTEEGADDDLVTLKKLIGENGLFYLPEGTTYNKDNFAYKTTTGFRTGENIVLTDKKPFFAPFDIQVDGAKYATYTRQVTVPQNGQVTNATMMLPFTLNLTQGGLHTNPDGKCSFSINKMNEGSQLDVKKNSNDGSAFFMPIEGNKTEPNVPYMVKVEQIDPSLIKDGKISFVVTQMGSSIVATPKEGDLGKKELVGESVTGDFGGSYKFTNWASYSGVKYDRANGQDIFYFANNKYLNLHTLTASKRYLYSYPFRGIYRYEAASTAKQMRWFDIVYGENPFFDTPTDIDMQKTQPDLMVKAGKGELTLTATRSQDVTIHTIGGVTTHRVSIASGDTQTVALPAGAYIINNVKVIVK